MKLKLNTHGITSSKANGEDLLFDVKNSQLGHAKFRVLKGSF